MFEHDTTNEHAVRFSRFDEENLLSTVSTHSFQLENKEWLTVEHYYQTHKFEGLPYTDTILSSTTGLQAYKLGNRWLKRKADNWKAMRRLWMTRALYRKASEHPEVKQALVDTKSNLIIETSLYDHYWGIGRDQRGQNILGKVWMDIRKKLQEK